MKLKFTIPLIILLSGFALQMIGQRTIKGTIKSNEGEPLIGASVVVKGTSNGAISDLDGNYQLKAKDGDYLVFSYIGFNSKEVLVKGQSVIDVVLDQGVALDEVVVTALGISKPKKSLSYAIENIKNEQLLKGNQQNLPNAIKGKVAGVTVTNSGGAPGASSVILIRGGNSLSGDNQPLFVVDGIPIDNSTERGQNVSTSNRAIDINSEDIESVSILKGPAAAALYGIKAANGAVIITTKSGKAGKAEISYSGSVSFDRVIGTPEYQKVYGQGTKFLNGTVSKETNLSWADTPLPDSVPIYDNLADFYQPAMVHNHNLTYSGGTEKTTFYLSSGFLDQKGVIDRTRYRRGSIRLKAGSKLKDNLNVTASVSYINSNSDRTRQGSANSGSFRSILSYPIDINMKDYENPDGSQRKVANLDNAKNDNPYWSIKHNPINNRVDRFLSVGNISYSPYKFMNITYRLGTDIYFAKNKSVYAYGSSIFETGYLGEYSTFNQITTSTLLLNLNKKFGDFSANLTLGNNIEDNFRRKTYWSGVEFIEPDFISINNIEADNRSVGQSISRHRIIGNFGDFKIDWKSLIFLNLTGRYDMSSTLPKFNNKFFYPSVGLSLIVDDLLRETSIADLSDYGISFWKIRSTLAQVGKDAPPHVLATPMMSATNSFTVDPQGFFRSVYPSGNPGLLPEFTSSFEVGTDLRLLNNRVSVDFAYYHNISDEQILFVRLPPTTGTFGGYLNGGSITNKGIELLLGINPVKTKNINWQLDFNFTKSHSRVNSLPGTIKQVEESDSWAFNGIAEGAAFLDGPVFGIYGRTYERDSLGNLLLDSKGMVKISSQLTMLGDREPDWTLGVTNTFDYKDFTLSFLWDISYGNDVVNATEAALVYYGLSPITLDRYTTHVFDGLRQAGFQDGHIVYEPNDKEVILDQQYYQKKYGAVANNFIEDGSWIRLRYISLAYNIPFKKNMKGQFYINARNMLIFTKYTGVDPEVNTIGASVKGTGSIGIDNLGTPSTKGIDLGFKFTF